MRPLILFVCFQLTIVLVVVNDVFGQNTIETPDHPFIKRKVFLDVPLGSEEMEGRYEAYAKNDRLLYSGNFENGLKSGLWITYDTQKPNSKTKILCSGKYTFGRKIGEWTWFDSLSNISLVYDFTKETFVTHFEETGSDSILMKIEGESFWVEIDRPVMYAGGRSMFSYYINMIYAFYPEKQKAKLPEKADFSFLLNHLGEIINPKVLNEMSAEQKEEAIRFFNFIPNDWLPMVVQGRPAQTKVQFPIKFSLD